MTAAGVHGDARVLIVDDDRDLLEVLRLGLAALGYEVVTSTSPAAALRALVDPDFGVVLTDLDMPGMSGLDLCRQIVVRRERVAVIVMTGSTSVHSAVAAMRAGACDFLPKPFGVDIVAASIARAQGRAATWSQAKRVQDGVRVPHGVNGILGESAAVRRMCEVVARMARSDATVLVTGESGTGKELVARALHAWSPRASGPFVAVNCSALPAPLLESELFGHERGAFTDARDARPGLFARATGGTLFLDEIGEMPAGVQAKLLRALQERVVRPVGGSDTAFDARIVAASNRDLEKEVAEGRFREDLYYRINVLPVSVPPLRERENDAIVLAQAFVQRHRRVVGITPATADQLLAYPWPGNVRELQNCIERAAALSTSDHIGVRDLPDRVRQYRRSRDVCLDGVSQDGFLTLCEVERRYYGEVLDAVAGSRAKAARWLGVDRRTVYRKLGEWKRQPERMTLETRAAAHTPAGPRRRGPELHRSARAQDPLVARRSPGR